MAFDEIQYRPINLRPFRLHQVEHESRQLSHSKCVIP